AALSLVCAAVLSGALIPPVPADDGGRSGPTTQLTVDLALGGSVTASSAQAAAPASSAIDGSASTSWCPIGASASLIVDLGRPRRLEGVGLTLPAVDAPATASISLAGDSRRWETVSESTAPVPVSAAAYLPLPKGAMTARYARLEISSADGSPACVSEFRLF